MALHEKSEDHQSSYSSSWGEHEWTIESDGHHHPLVCLSTVTILCFSVSYQFKLNVWTEETVQRSLSTLKASEGHVGLLSTVGRLIS